MIKKLLMITGNPGKAEELKKLLHMENVEISYKDLDIHEIQSLNLEEVGYHKTRSALSFANEVSPFDAVLTDDTGLCCEALNGLPGPLIKWFLHSIGPDGVLDMLQKKDNATTASCLLSLGIVKSGEIIQFRGDVPGQFVSPKGKDGFGWDQYFLPDQQGKTYGEMSLEEKNTISHRSKAIKKLKTWIESGEQR